MFNFSRRINRITYWTGFMLDVVILSALLLLTGSPSQLLQTIAAICFLLFLVVGSVYFVALARQRANDVGKYVLPLTLMGLCAPLGFVVLGVLPGQPIQNNYGHPPKPGVKLRG